MTLIIQWGLVLTPMAMLAATWAGVRPDLRRRGAAMLSSLWVFVGLVALDVVAELAGWWSFDPALPSLGRIPGEVLWAWVVIWGAVVGLIADRASPWLIVGALALVDVGFMPLLEPTVVLGPTWLVGEAVALAALALPATYLARWTIRDEHLGARVTLQMVLFAGLTLWALPQLVFERTGDTWPDLATRPRGMLMLQIGLLMLFGIPAVAAVLELRHAGEGTPFPYDPPKRLVTSGPYSYIANPMQASMSVLLPLWAWFLESPWLAAGAVVAVAYGAGLAHWHESSQMGSAHGDAWKAYRTSVRSWIPRSRPHVPEPARLWVSQTCDQCTEFGDWLDRFDLIGVERRGAEQFNRPLQRIHYTSGPIERSGLGAVSRALQHHSLPVAWLAWCLEPSPVRWLGQLVADALGAGPREIPYCPAPTPTALSRR